MLATVTTGLYISWNGLRLISAETRLQGIFFWDFLIYVTEGMIFLITGLQARALIAGIRGYSMSDLAVWARWSARSSSWRGSSGCIRPPICRAGWCRRSRARIRRRRGRWPFVLSFTGVRGIVSLAAALAIPLVTEDGRRFPDRDLILFLTFAVILVTLVGQGLLLPTRDPLARTGRCRPARAAWRCAARNWPRAPQAIEAAIEQLDELTTARGLPQEVVAPIRAHQQSRLNHVWHRSEDGESHQRIIALHDEIERLLISVERDRINELYRARQTQG